MHITMVTINKQLSHLLMLDPRAMKKLREMFREKYTKRLRNNDNLS